jgi:uncharacterized protein involved in type VI secretion and phage assembly
LGDPLVCYSPTPDLISPMKSTRLPLPATSAITYFGKYRGTVVDNIDPQQIGRVMALVPDVLGESPSSWAMPCVPAAGIQSGIFIVPPVGSSVWMEFEQGNPDYPIWTGGFWPLVSALPTQAVADEQSIVLQTTGQNSVAISDMPGPLGGIILKSSDGAMISVNNAGITLDNGQGATVALDGSSVMINEQVYAASPAKRKQK